MPQSGFFYRLPIADPDDEDNIVNVLMNAAVVLVDLKTRAQISGWILNNGEDTSRIGREFEVLNPEDESQKLRVERVGAFFLLDRKTYAELRAFIIPTLPRDKDAPDGSQSHLASDVVRYCQDNDPDSDVWIEVERIWATVVRDAKEYSQLYLMLSFWPDTLGDEIEDGSSPFPARFCEVPDDLPLDNRATTDVNKFDKFWRTDLSQNVINVNWGKQLLVIAATITGSLFPEKYTFLTPAVAATEDLEAIGAQTAIIENVDDLATNQWSLRGENAPPPAPTTPITKEMLELDAIWKPNLGVLSEGGSKKTVTIFVNYAAYKKQWPVRETDDKKHVKFYIDLPENTAPGPGFHIWELTASYTLVGEPSSPIVVSGTTKFYDFPGSDPNVYPGTGYYEAQSAIALLKFFEEAGVITGVSISGPSDLGKDPDHLILPNNLVYHFEFSIWGRKDVPLGADSLPSWEFGAHNVVTFEFGGAPPKPATRLMIEIVGSEITITQISGVGTTAPPAAP